MDNINIRGLIMDNKFDLPYNAQIFIKSKFLKAEVVYTENFTFCQKKYLK